MVVTIPSLHLGLVATPLADCTDEGVRRDSHLSFISNRKAVRQTYYPREGLEYTVLT